ncbi:MAG: hypothetical protein ACREO0_10335 [Pseudoxanthomonas sp.]
MNTRIMLPLAALPLIAVGLLATAMAAASLADPPTDAPADARITDFPIVTVHPTPQDAAYFRKHRIVDLPRITVRPESGDLALFLADSTARIVHLPVSLPQASVLDRQRAAVPPNAFAAR